MSSKLDYLKKYESTGYGESKKRRRKKGSKSGQTVPKVVGLRIVDDEADDNVMDLMKVEEAWEGPEAEEEKPVVMAASEAKKMPTGSWVSVEEAPLGKVTFSGGGDQSPPRRKKRGAESNSRDLSPPRRKRHDSPVVQSEDTSPPRKKRHDSPIRDASPPRRRLWDSSVSHGDDASPPRRKKRRELHTLGMSPPRQRHDNIPVQEDDASPPCRNRNGYGGSGEDVSPPRRRRHDSPSSPQGKDSSNIYKAAGKHHTLSKDTSPQRRNREGINNSTRGHGDDKVVESSRKRQEHGDSGGVVKGREVTAKIHVDKGARAKTSSGFYAGLQSGEDFKAVEQHLKNKHRAEMAGADAERSGAGAETVYRDRKGRKLDMLNEMIRQQDARAGKKVQQAKEAFEWGRGKVQKEEEKQFKEEVENIAQEPFARSIEDSRLEAAKKEAIRDGDPMAASIMKKRNQAMAKSGKPVKKEYKGPPPKPNRFGVKPGHRWDGVDRGNGWEEKIVAKAVEGRYKEDLAYQWASADM